MAKFKFDSEIEIQGFEHRPLIIAGANGWTVSQVYLNNTQIDSGLDPDVNRFKLNGRITANVPKIVAKIRVDAQFGKHFTQVPSLETSFKNNISLQFIRTEKTNNKITSYVFYLIYTNNVRTTSSSNLKASIKYKTEVTVTRATTIDRVDFGSSFIKNSGESRSIKVYGTPGATFGLAINESFEQTLLGEDGNLMKEVGELFTDKVSDVPLKELTKEVGLAKNLFKKPNKVARAISKISTTTHNYGKEISVIQGIIGSGGLFSFQQKFPSNVVKKTLIDGAKSSTATIDFDDVTGIRVGDRIYSPSIPRTTIIKVSSVGSTTRLVLDTAITIADNIPVFFKRRRLYNIDIIPDLTSTLGSKMPTTEPAFKLFQYMDPVLTIKHLVPSGMKLTHHNDVATSFGAGDDLSIFFEGKPNLSKKDAKSLSVTTAATVKVLYDLNDAAENFSVIRIPTFSKTTQANSTWSNSLPLENKGTNVSISGIFHTLQGSNTFTLQYNLEVVKWGNEDVTMEIDVENFTTVA